MEGTSCDNILPFMVERLAGILWHMSKNDDEKIVSEAKIDDGPVISQAQL